MSLEILTEEEKDLAKEESPGRRCSASMGTRSLRSCLSTQRK